MNFNSFSNAHPDKDYNIDAIPSGGIGIKLIGKIADELTYTRTPDARNCLFVVKYFPPPNATQAGFFRLAINRISNIFQWMQKWRTRPFDRTLSPPLKTINLQLSSDIKAVTEVLLWFEQLEQLPIPEAVLQQCKLVAIEAFTNAVRHAHKDLPLETPIDLSVEVFQDRLELEICDRGQPFDLKSKLAEELSEASPFNWNELGFTFH